METNILRVANVFFDSRIGGSQVRSVQVANKLRDANIETVFVAPRENNESFQQLLDRNGLSYIFLNINRLSRYPSELLRWFAFFFPQLMHYYNAFREKGVDIVHVNSIRNIKAILAGKIHGARIVIHLNDTVDEGIKSFLFRAFFIMTYLLCDGYAVAGRRVFSTYFNESYEYTDFEKVLVEVQAPVDTDEFDPATVQPHSKMSKLSKKNINITTVGNMNPAKGLTYFVEMAHLISQNCDTCSFHVVGKPNSPEIYNTLLNTRDELGLRSLQFWTDDPEIPQILKSSDIYVCTSRWEASPIAVWEAMAMKLPVVTTDVGDVKRFIEDGRSGFVVDRKDPVALARKVEELIGSPQLRFRLGSSARCIVEGKLDVKSCVTSHKDLYNQVLKG